MIQPKHKQSRQANYWFVVLAGLGGLWSLIGLGVIWQYTGEIFNYLYYICQSRWDSLIQQMPNTLILLIPAFMVGIVGRGLYLLMLRWLRIRQFNRRLRLLQHPSEPRLYQVAKQIDLPVDTVGCLRASTAMVVPLAFSSGLWRPKIWISKTTLNLLTDQELAAVLHHEAHHCQQRDPLKRFISHLVSDVFFFVPLLRALETQIHLTQEIAADTNTIDAMGDAIPLASALHKLLTTPKTPPDICANIAISQFNLTEKRIAALISPGQPQPWQPTLSRWVISTAVALLLLGSTTLAQPQKHTQFTACTLDTLPGYTFDLSEFLTVAP